jgi:putative transposase
VTAFIDQHRGQFGVERVCRTLGVSASAYHHRKTGARSVRVIEDERLTERIRELHLANYEAYGYRRMHAALTRAGERVSRDRVARLMRREGIVGAKHRGKPWRTTIPDLTAVKRPDLVKRDFTARAPDRLWVGDFERHEALCDRAVMKGHRRWPVAAGRLKLGAARSTGRW